MCDNILAAGDTTVNMANILDLSEHSPVEGGASSAPVEASFQGGFS